MNYFSRFRFIDELHSCMSAQLAVDILKILESHNEVQAKRIMHVNKGNPTNIKLYGHSSWWPRGSGRRARNACTPPADRHRHRVRDALHDDAQEADLQPKPGPRSEDQLGTDPEKVHQCTTLESVPQLVYEHLAEYSGDHHQPRCSAGRLRFSPKRMVAIKIVVWVIRPIE